MTGRYLAVVSAFVVLAGCTAAPDRSAGCIPSDTLVDLDGEIFVMSDDCGEGTLRTVPATAADIARLEAPL